MLLSYTRNPSRLSEMDSTYMGRREQDFRPWGEFEVLLKKRLRNTGKVDIMTTKYTLKETSKS